MPLIAVALDRPHGRLVDTYGVVSQIASVQHALPSPTNAAVRASKVGVALWSTIADRVCHALRAGAACLAHGVIVLIAGSGLILVCAAHRAVQAREVGVAVRRAFANPILLA